MNPNQSNSPSSSSSDMTDGSRNTPVQLSTALTQLRDMDASPPVFSIVPVPEMLSPLSLNQGVGGRGSVASNEQEEVVVKGNGSGAMKPVSEHAPRFQPHNPGQPQSQYVQQCYPHYLSAYENDSAQLNAMAANSKFLSRTFLMSISTRYNVLLSSSAHPDGSDVRMFPPRRDSTMEYVQYVREYSGALQAKQAPTELSVLNSALRIVNHIDPATVALDTTDVNTVQQADSNYMKYWRGSLDKGSFIDAMDSTNSWYIAEIERISSHTAWIRYDGWSSKFSESIPLNSVRLAPFLSKVKLHSRKVSDYRIDITHALEKKRIEVISVTNALRSVGIMSDQPLLLQKLALMLSEIDHASKLDYTDNRSHTTSPMLQCDLMLDEPHDMGQQPLLPQPKVNVECSTLLPRTIRNIVTYLITVPQQSAIPVAVHRNYNYDLETMFYNLVHQHNYNGFVESLPAVYHVNVRNQLRLVQDSLSIVDIGNITLKYDIKTIPELQTDSASMSSVISNLSSFPSLSLENQDPSLEEISLPSDNSILSYSSQKGIDQKSTLFLRLRNLTKQVQTALCAQKQGVHDEQKDDVGQLCSASESVAHYHTDFAPYVETVALYSQNQHQTIPWIGYKPMHMVQRLFRGLYCEQKGTTSKIDHLHEQHQRMKTWLEQPFHDAGPDNIGAYISAKAGITCVLCCNSYYRNPYHPGVLQNIHAHHHLMSIPMLSQAESLLQVINVSEDVQTQLVKRYRPHAPAADLTLPPLTHTVTESLERVEQGLDAEPKPRFFSNFEQDTAWAHISKYMANIGCILQDYQIAACKGQGETTRAQYHSLWERFGDQECIRQLRGQFGNIASVLDDKIPEYARFREVVVPEGYVPIFRGMLGKRDQVLLPALQMQACAGTVPVTVARSIMIPQNNGRVDVLEADAPLTSNSHILASAQASLMKPVHTCMLLKLLMDLKLKPLFSIPSAIITGNNSAYTMPMYMREYGLFRHLSLQVALHERIVKHSALNKLIHNTFTMNLSCAGAIMSSDSVERPYIEVVDNSYLSKLNELWHTVPISHREDQPDVIAEHGEHGSTDAALEEDSRPIVERYAPGDIVQYQRDVDKKWVHSASTLQNKHDVYDITKLVGPGTPLDGVDSILHTYFTITVKQICSPNYRKKWRELRGTSEHTEIKSLIENMPCRSSMHKLRVATRAVYWYMRVRHTESQAIMASAKALLGQTADAHGGLSDIGDVFRQPHKSQHSASVLQIEPQTLLPASTGVSTTHNVQRQYNSVSDSNGDFVYVLDGDGGQCICGTGRGNTVNGKIYRLSKVWSIHAGGKLAYIPPTECTRVDLTDEDVNTLKENGITLESTGKECSQNEIPEECTHGHIIIWSPLAPHLLLRANAHTQEACTPVLVGSASSNSPSMVLPFQNHFLKLPTAPIQIHALVPPPVLTALGGYNNYGDSGKEHSIVGTMRGSQFVTSLVPGTLVDACDKDGFWYLAVITSVTRGKEQVAKVLFEGTGLHLSCPLESVVPELSYVESMSIHFDGWPPHYDEVISIHDTTVQNGQCTVCKDERCICNRILPAGTVTALPNSGFKRHHNPKERVEQYYLPDSLTGQHGYNRTNTILALDPATQRVISFPLKSNGYTIAAMPSWVNQQVTDIACRSTKMMDDGFIIPLGGIEDPDRIVQYGLIVKLGTRQSLRSVQTHPLSVLDHATVEFGYETVDSLLLQGQSGALRLCAAVVEIPSSKQDQIPGTRVATIFGDFNIYNDVLSLPSTTTCGCGYGVAEIQGLPNVDSQVGGGKSSGLELFRSITLFHQNVVCDALPEVPPPSRQNQVTFQANTQIYPAYVTVADTVVVCTDNSKVASKPLGLTYDSSNFQITMITHITTKSQDSLEMTKVCLQNCVKATLLTPLIPIPRCIPHPLARRLQIIPHMPSSLSMPVISSVQIVSSKISLPPYSVLASVLNNILSASKLQWKAAKAPLANTNKAYTQKYDQFRKYKKRSMVVTYNEDVLSYPFFATSHIPRALLSHAIDTIVPCVKQEPSTPQYQQLYEHTSSLHHSDSIVPACNECGISAAVYTRYYDSVTLDTLYTFTFDVGYTRNPAVVEIYQADDIKIASQLGQLLGGPGYFICSNLTCTNPSHKHRITDSTFIPKNDDVSKMAQFTEEASTHPNLLHLHGQDTKQFIDTLEKTYSQNLAYYSQYIVCGACQSTERYMDERSIFSTADLTETDLPAPILHETMSLRQIPDTVLIDNVRVLHQNYVQTCSQLHRIIPTEPSEPSLAQKMVEDQRTDMATQIAVSPLEPSAAHLAFEFRTGVNILNVFDNCTYYFDPRDGTTTFLTHLNAFFKDQQGSAQSSIRNSREPWLYMHNIPLKQPTPMHTFHGFTINSLCTGFVAMPKIRSKCSNLAFWAAHRPLRSVFQKSYHTELQQDDAGREQPGDTIPVRKDADYDLAIPHPLVNAAFWGLTAEYTQVESSLLLGKQYAVREIEPMNTFTEESAAPILMVTGRNAKFSSKLSSVNDLKTDDEDHEEERTVDRRGTYTDKIGLMGSPLLAWASIVSRLLVILSSPSMGNALTMKTCLQTHMLTDLQCDRNDKPSIAKRLKNDCHSQSRTLEGVTSLSYLQLLSLRACVERAFVHSNLINGVLGALRKSIGDLNASFVLHPQAHECSLSGEDCSDWLNDPCISSDSSKQKEPYNIRPNGIQRSLLFQRHFCESVVLHKELPPQMGILTLVHDYSNLAKAVEVYRQDKTKFAAVGDLHTLVPDICILALIGSATKTQQLCVDILTEGVELLYPSWYQRLHMVNVLCSTLSKYITERKTPIKASMTDDVLNMNTEQSSDEKNPCEDPTVHFDFTNLLGTSTSAMHSQREMQIVRNSGLFWSARLYRSIYGRICNGVHGALGIGADICQMFVEPKADSIIPPRIIGSYYAYTGSGCSEAMFSRNNSTPWSFHQLESQYPKSISQWRAQPTNVSKMVINNCSAVGHSKVGLDTMMHGNIVDAFYGSDIPCPSNLVYLHAYGKYYDAVVIPLAASASYLAPAALSVFSPETTKLVEKTVSNAFNDVVLGSRMSDIDVHEDGILPKDGSLQEWEGLFLAGKAPDSENTHNTLLYTSLSYISACYKLNNSNIPFPHYSFATSTQPFAPLSQISSRLSRNLISIYLTHMSAVANHSLHLVPTPKVITSPYDSYIYRVGEEVHARWNGGNAFYPGQIRAINLDNTYQVSFGDGDFDDKVPKMNLRPMSWEGDNAESENVKSYFDKNSVTQETTKTQAGEIISISVPIGDGEIMEARTVEPSSNDEVFIGPSCTMDEAITMQLLDDHYMSQLPTADPAVQNLRLLEGGVSSFRVWKDRLSGFHHYKSVATNEAYRRKLQWRVYFEQVRAHHDPELQNQYLQHKPAAATACVTAILAIQNRFGVLLRDCYHGIQVDMVNIKLIRSVNALLDKLNSNQRTEFWLKLAAKRNVTLIPGLLEQVECKDCQAPYMNYSDLVRSEELPGYEKTLVVDTLHDFRYKTAALLENQGMLQIYSLAHKSKKVFFADAPQPTLDTGSKLMKTLRLVQSCIAGSHVAEPWHICPESIGPIIGDRISKMVVLFRDCRTTGMYTIVNHSQAQLHNIPLNQLSLQLCREMLLSLSRSSMYLNIMHQLVQKALPEHPYSLELSLPTSRPQHIRTLVDDIPQKSNTYFKIASTSSLALATSSLALPMLPQDSKLQAQECNQAYKRLDLDDEKVLLAQNGNNGNFIDFLAKNTCEKIIRSRDCIIQRKASLISNLLSQMSSQALINLQKLHILALTDGRNEKKLIQPTITAPDNYNFVTKACMYKEFQTAHSYLHIDFPLLNPKIEVCTQDHLFSQQQSKVSWPIDLRKTLTGDTSNDREEIAFAHDHLLNLLPSTLQFDATDPELAKQSTMENSKASIAVRTKLKYMVTHKQLDNIFKEGQIEREDPTTLLAQEALLIDFVKEPYYPAGLDILTKDSLTHEECHQQYGMCLGCDPSGQFAPLDSEIQQLTMLHPALGKLKYRLKCIRPAFVFSILAQTMLAEMGGGVSSFSMVESFSVEKLYLVALWRQYPHTRLLYDVEKFVYGYHMHILIQAKLTHRARLLTHPSCPKWLDTSMRECFTNIRTAILRYLRVDEARSSTLAKFGAFYKNSTTDPNAGVDEVVDLSKSAMSGYTQYLDSVKTAGYEEGLVYHAGIILLRRMFSWCSNIHQQSVGKVFNADKIGSPCTLVEQELLPPRPAHVPKSSIHEPAVPLTGNLDQGNWLAAFTLNNHGISIQELKDSLSLLYSCAKLRSDVLLMISTVMCETGLQVKNIGLNHYAPLVIGVLFQTEFKNWMLPYSSSLMTNITLDAFNYENSFKEWFLMDENSGARFPPTNSVYGSLEQGMNVYTTHYTLIKDNLTETYEAYHKLRKLIFEKQKAIETISDQIVIVFTDTIKDCVYGNLHETDTWLSLLSKRGLNIKSHFRNLTPHLVDHLTMLTHMYQLDSRLRRLQYIVLQYFGSLTFDAPSKTPEKVRWNHGLHTAGLSCVHDSIVSCLSKNRQENQAELDILFATRQIHMILRTSLLARLNPSVLMRCDHAKRLLDEDNHTESVLKLQSSAPYQGKEMIRTKSDILSLVNIFEIPNINTLMQHITSTKTLILNYGNINTLSETGKKECETLKLGVQVCMILRSIRPYLPVEDSIVDESVIMKAKKAVPDTIDTILDAQLDVGLDLVISPTVEKGTITECLLLEGIEEEDYDD